jgi:hypothetical protein
VSRDPAPKLTIAIVGFDAQHQVGEMPSAPVHPGVDVRPERPDIPAGREGTASSCDHDGLGIRIVLRLADGSHQRGRHVAVERVEAVRPIEQDDRYLPTPADLDDAHDVSSCVGAS